MGQAKLKREQQTTGRPLALVQAHGPKRISAADGAYLRKVREGLQQAVQWEQQAAQLRQQAAQLDQQVVARYGAHESWVEHLCEVYRCNKDTDNIDHDTLLITRVPTVESVTDTTPPEPTTSLKAPRPKAQGKTRPGGAGAGEGVGGSDGEVPEAPSDE